MSQNYKTNSIFKSTLVMERSFGYVPRPKTEIIYNDPLYEDRNLRYNAGFFLWRTILMDYGLPDTDAFNLLNLMCKDMFRTNGGNPEEYGLIIHIRVKIEGKYEKILKKKLR